MAHEGRAIIVFAVVTQFDSATGDDTFRANVSATQPMGTFELETNTELVGDANQLRSVAREILPLSGDRRIVGAGVQMDARCA